ncbi:hypothetical protein ACFSKU_16950 [Pontibacter silvestris]|uniref:Uncharacterized protein n=1 Tax=Pontibacter silvestris TaxID=2305183 RepID=A0ABW4X3L0_9BACT|nr:hypothetical protein [Pontibacter silvestris]MCC9135712.1 hypothetical protein [Pontibacter silvestris]
MEDNKDNKSQDNQAQQEGQYQQPEGQFDPHSRPVRVIDEDTTEQELRAGYVIPGADAPKNEHQRGGFGNRDGKEGYGSDTAGQGPSATGVNDYSDDGVPPPDNLRSEGEGRGT